MHPVTCSLLWVRCLFDPLSISDFGRKVKISENVFPDSTEHRTTFRSQIWWKSAVAKLLKGRLDYDTKKLGLHRTRPSLQFCPKWADRAQNSLNVVHVYWIWSGSAALCPTYSAKIDFFYPKSKYNKDTGDERKLPLVKAYTALKTKKIGPPSAKKWGHVDFQGSNNGFFKKPS